MTKPLADGISVLILEDDPVDAEVLMHNLIEAGVQLNGRLARSRDEFVQALDNHPPDLILADYLLPQFTAIDAVTLLRERNLRIPLIVVTGYLGDEMAAECIKQGACDYLLKDRLSRLPQAIQKALEMTRLEAAANSQQRQLVESECRFRTLADSIPQMVWTASAKGDPEFCNARWFEYTGLTMPPVGGDAEEWWLRPIHEENRLEAIARWRESLASGNPFQTECQLRRASDGSFRWFLCRAFPEKGADGKLAHWFGTWTDVDDRRKHDEQLRQQQKLDSMGMVAAGVAHDFNNLLAGILGNASLAAESLDKSHPARSKLEVVMQASERASHLTQQLLAYAGKAQVIRETVFLSGLIPETCNLLRASIRKGVRIVEEIPLDLPPVDADPGQIQQLIINLVINGSEAIDDPSGSVFVRAMVIPGNALSERHDFVQLEVQDTGVGMDDATSARIFEPFFTTKPSGHGLGLAAVAGIVRGYGGAINLSSAPGRGTTFRVLLPTTDAPANGIASVQTPATAAREKLGILIVDDEEMIRETISAMTEWAGPKHFLVDDGATAVQVFGEHKDEIGIVVLDVNMPGQPVSETIAGLRRVRNDIPIILATGYSSVEVATYIKHYGRIRFLPKPFTMNQLKKALLEFIG